jgi:ABC-type branched-subunit amino acid transport system permease subunit
MSTLFFYIASYFAILLVGASIILLLRRLVRRNPLFTERDWLALFGCTKAEALRLNRWICLTMAAAVVSLIGFAESVFLLPIGVDIFFITVSVTVSAIVLITPRIFRLPVAHESTRNQ